MIMSKSDFAKLKGWNRSTATRYAEAGKIVVTPEGKVDVEASEKRLSEIADPRKEGVRRRHERERALRGDAGDADGDRVLRDGHGAALSFGMSALTKPGITFTDEQLAIIERAKRASEAVAAGASAAHESLKPEPGDTSYLALQKARAESEMHRAALLRLEREEKEGRLVDAETMRKQVFAMTRLVRNRLMGLRHHIDPELAGEADPVKRAEIWDKQMRAICEEFARTAEVGGA